MSKMLDMLLRPNIPDVQKELPTAKYRVKRLSELAGEDVTFTLRALPYGRVTEIREGNSTKEDMEVQIVLAGVVEPELRSPQLMEHFGAPSCAEAVKSLLLPGEIVDLSLSVEKLCGYRRMTIEEVKNA